MENLVKYHHIKRYKTGLRFVNFANEIYILCKQKKKIFQVKDQLIQQLYKSEEHLRQAKKKLEPTQETLNLINKQETLFNEMFINNKAIVLQKLTTK